MNSIRKEVVALIALEIKLEWRSKYALGGIVLYIASTILVCYLSFREIISPDVWNALFWIIVLFASLNAVSKSFLQESSARQLYLYTLAAPQSIILAKIIYNVMLLVILSLVCFAIYSLFIGNMVKDLWLFLVALLLGSSGFAALMTLISAIASKTNRNLTLVAILTFPIQIPLLITVIRLSEKAISGMIWLDCIREISILSLINLMIVILGYVLFPYVWRD